MPAYETTFSPPAAVARATVRGPNGRVVLDVPLLIDTGADVSVVPMQIARELGADIQRSDTTVELLDGSRLDADAAELTIEILRFRFRGRYLVADAPYGVLGRNILNLLVLTLDGPNRLWTA
jgi:predicted aspartyl protease